MKLNKKKAISFLIILFLFLVIFSWGQAKAAGTSFEDVSGLKNAGTGVGYDTTKPTSSIALTIGNIIGAVLGLVGLVFMFLIWMGAFDIIGSGGNEEDVKKGKGRIKDGAIGILIIFSAYILSKVVITIISGEVFKIGGF
ncbi:hypothetical protein COV49_04160 [Candidatus Falkowbacteria bacterium CG11_big_fil_rev_8_21_14_0_20_39_10]|uniref:Uncharacterized protein n=1 Tax=Candidatus Falkowbacteria bacterium CG11_big_fil_rev_8_21_14_0_20_39_10 TaxID=1974570 RepID=A0A2M6K831_9BACT|nr:MAG: hypothetical protein COV49_04160 [Candidatus Falkowbacteria bacterium CG11_big_fil_rev_8_21_14_0_20_39_10]